MKYFLNRGGRQYGPYALTDLERYWKEGLIVEGDLARSEDMQDWIPAVQIVGIVGAPVPPPPPPPVSGEFSTKADTRGPAVSERTPLPPSLHWGLVLLSALFTFGLFEIVWSFVQANWVKRIAPNSNALVLYGASICAFVSSVVVAVSAASVYRSHSEAASALMGLLVGLLFLATPVLWLLGVFDIRSSLMAHFNSVEPIGLRLSGIMTFFFHTLYFQYHLTRIHDRRLSATLRS